MDKFKNTPASMRYLGARLKPFRRPMFWGSIGLVSLIGLTLYQYWLHPDWINGSLSEVQAPSNSATGRLSNLTEQGQISAEDLAIGAELDNLDVLLKELEQNQTVPLTDTVGQKKSPNALPSGKKDTVYQRFQEKQKSKLTRSPDPLIPKNSSSASNNLTQSPTRGIFQLPKTNGYNSLLPPAPSAQTSNSSTSELIPNPVGRLYLSAPNRLGSTAPSRPTNSLSPLNPSAATTNSVTPSSSDAITTPSVNSGLTNTFVTPSVVPYSNNINLPTTPPTSTYGQPLYPQSANINRDRGVVGNQGANVLPTRLPANNLSNQQQTQRVYQINPSNYQLQPQRYNQQRNQNINTGFNSQPSTFSPNASFESSPFNNN